MQKWKVGHGIKYSNVTFLFRFFCVWEENWIYWISRWLLQIAVIWNIKNLYLYLPSISYFSPATEPTVSPNQAWENEPSEIYHLDDKTFPEFIETHNALGKCL